MNEHARLTRMMLLGLALGVAACGDDGGGQDTDGGTDTEAGTDSATDSASTDPTATNTQTGSDTVDSDSESESDTSPTDSGTGSGGTDSGGTDSATTVPADTDDTSSTGTGSADTGSTGGVAGATISGVLQRGNAAYIYAGNDGIGDAYLGLLVACEQDAEAVNGATVEDADVSDTSNMVPFMIEGVEDGTYYIAGFLDDNENADPNDPMADQGDLAMSENLDIACVEVTVTGGADVTADPVVFNLTVPF